MMSSCLIAVIIITILSSSIKGFNTNHKFTNKIQKNESHSYISTRLWMGGFGTTSKPKKTKKKTTSNKKKNEKFDVSASLLRSEKLYDKLCSEWSKSIANSLEDDKDDETSDGIVTEYMIAARYSPSSKPIPGSTSLRDWTPIAQLCLLRSSSEENDGKHLLTSAISAHCREIHFAATLAAPAVASLPRNAIEYSIEPIDDFHKFVYDEVMEISSASGTVSKAEARRILGLEEGCNDLQRIKTAYRTLSFELHPDRFIGVDRTDDETKDTTARYAQVKMAYETLISGIRVGDDAPLGSLSWYESLGGRSRTNFVGPVSLLPMEDARRTMQKGVGSGGYECAVVGIDTDVVMTFIARNQAVASSI